MSPKLKLPSVPLHCPRCPKSSDFIALDCPQFGNKIGDSCPALPWVAQRFGDSIGNEFCRVFTRVHVLASFHASFSILRSFVRSQAGIFEGLDRQLAWPNPPLTPPWLKRPRGPPFLLRDCSRGRVCRTHRRPFRLTGET